MTSLRYYFFLIFTGLATFSYGQVPSDILLQPATDVGPRACPDRNAGTVQLGQFVGQSSDVTLARSFFCINDQLDFIHNGDAEVVDSDPNAATPPGIGYAWYTCLPTVDRPTLTDVFTDPCLLTDPTPNMGIYVYVDDINGDARFQNGNQINGQSVPDFFNNGEPIEVWFAPITIDAVNAGQAVFEGTPAGPCVHANIDAAFSIVYLTPTSAVDRRIVPDGSGGCLGSFMVTGGLPQFDATTSYDIVIEHTTMAGSFATLVGSNYGHEDQVTFSFVEEGRYRVTISDDKSCSYSFEMDLLCTNPVTFTIPDVTADNAMTVCIPISLDGFVDMGTTSFDVIWNPNVFEYVSNSGFLIDADVLAQIVDINAAQGTIKILWLPQNILTGQTEPNGTVFFELCLRAIGDCGESTPIFFGPQVIVSDINRVDLAYLVNDGTATINNNGGLESLADVCPDDGTGTGSIKLTMCGGLAPYSINYSGPSGGTGTISEQNGMQLIENLAAGNYTFNIMDANMDLLVEMVTIPSGTVPNVNLATDDPTCSYTSDGKIGVSITPPGSYEIEWSTNAFNTDTIRNVANGQYRVTVTDANGCAVTESITVNTAELSVTGTITDATCVSSSDGRVFAQAFGGSPQYIFRWEGFPPSLPSDTDDRQNLMVGTYGLTVTDSEGCFHVESFTITSDRDVLVDDARITDNTCFGNSAGNIFVEASTLNSALGTYLFEWTRGGADVSSLFINSANTSQSNNDLPAGRYDVRITDFDLSLGCYLDTFFIVEQPDPIAVELVSMTPASCADDDGRLVIRVSGGSDVPNADLFLDWEVHPNLNDEETTQFGLPPDTFSLRIYQSYTNPMGGEQIDFDCFLDTFFVVTGEEGPVILRFDSTSVSCGSGMDGELEVILTPPGQTFSVEWLDQNNTAYSGNPITGLDAGTYFVTVTTTPGCETIDTVSLGQARDIALDSVRYRTPTCPTSGNGSITVFASGPGGGLHYQWNHPNGSDNNVLPGVPAGTYSVTITADGSNCAPLIIDTLTVRPPMIFAVDFSNIIGARCPGICNGEATVTATGGMGMINYRWSNGQTTQTATGLCAGINFVEVRDMLCFDTFYIDVPAGDSISLVSEVGNPSCSGDMDGFIRLSPSGNNPPFDIVWNDGPTGPNRTNLGSDTYIATITDGMGCERIDSFIIMTADPLVAEILPQDLLQITCAGRDDGRATITVTGGAGGYTYNWDPDVSQSDVGGNLMPGNYSVTVTDMAGCTDEVMFTISEPAAIEFIFGAQSQIRCFGETAQFTIDTAFSGAGGPYRFTVNNGLPQAIGNTVDLLGGDYFITVFDSAGCFIDSTITIAQPNEIAVDIGPDITVTLGDSAQLGVLTFMGDFPIDSFVWTSSGDGLSCVNCAEPWITPTADAIINLMVTDSTGCTAQDELLVFVDAQRKVFIPNAFSPNNDGINDDFQVFTGIGVREISQMQIFNRWGDRVFETRGLRASTQGSGGWDGTFQGEPLDSGVYLYVIEVTFSDNRTVVYSGDVQLVQ